MAEHHHHHESVSGTRLFITMFLNFIITIAEIIGGLLSGSLALISDALHNFTDGLAIVISYTAIKLKNKSHSKNHTFGFKRVEIFAAVLNSGILMAVCFYLFYEAVERLLHPTPVTGSLMLLIAVIGLAANVTGTLLLHRDSKHSANIRSAYLHLFADTLSSIGVIFGGVVITLWKINWVDPLITLLIAIYILHESFLVLSNSLHVLMEGAPPDVPVEKIRQIVEAYPGVINIHHIHLWTVGENDIHLQAHINMNDMPLSETNSIQCEIEEALQQQLGINHVTLQMECNVCQNAGLINSDCDSCTKEHRFH